MDLYEPKHRSSGWRLPTVIILLLLAAIAYLRITGKERIEFGCDATPATTP